MALHKVEANIARPSSVHPIPLTREAARLRSLASNGSALPDAQRLDKSCPDISEKQAPSIYIRGESGRPLILASETRSPVRPLIGCHLFAIFAIFAIFESLRGKAADSTGPYLAWTSDPV